MTTILDKILDAKKGQIQELLKYSIQEQNDSSVRPSLFESLYQSERLQVISEIKRASPSKGLIAEGVNPAKQASQYEQAGAACISVLTDTPFFQGTFEDLAEVARTVSIPILCKDFIIHPIQIDYAKHAGASVVLLIVAALDQEKLSTLYKYALSKGLEVLVEVHDSVELDRALQLDAKLIGVNNRDLRTFHVDLSRTAEIASIFPFEEQRVLISESGIWDSADAKKVVNYGASAVLVGESLMRSGDVGNALKSLQVKREVINS
ncbi:indole-3-glycerol phosphate synthase [Psychrobacillus sp. OK028]|uniref:indole-3-glycerol phosphate synthase TrpC n=1 Tax=Psychrobacillus sp. OK028 TaxID=1884359 RepID=UPI000884C508|nr:indole-3-glycerol phosphate synthase TrpC [Psychrobacillus sp. OK028]SDN09136.1 indole-3-glycerol phosphate synthase [Psychrobacillus sp. OK028]